MIIQGNELNSSTIQGLPIGFYYYIIPDNKVSEATYLGFVDTIQTLTYNPFLEVDDISTIKEVNFDTNRYGNPGNIPKCYRIETLDKIDKLLTKFKVFLSKNEDKLREPKLDCFPFKYYLVTDYSGLMLLIKPQLVKNNNFEIRVKTTSISQENKYLIYCKDYKSDEQGLIEGICNTSSYMLPVTSTLYSQFASTSMASFNQGNINAMLENDKTLNQGQSINNLNINRTNAMYGINQMSTVVGGLAGIVGNVMSGNVGGAIGSGVGAGFNMFKNSVNNKFDNMQNNLLNQQLSENHSLTEYEINASANAKMTDMLNTPNSIKTSGNDSIFNLIKSNKRIDVIEYGIHEAIYDKLYDYFKRYGYRLNRYATLGNMINSRKYYNYIKTNICNLKGEQLPIEHLEEFKNIFNNGTTIWHVDNGVEVNDYEIDRNNGGNIENE